MKWGTNKNKKLPPSSNITTTSSSSSSNKPSLISHVFPSSWLLKFKQKSGDSEPTLSKVKRKGPSLRSPRSASRGGGGRFYGDDDGEDGFWRLSFGEDSAEVRHSSFGSCQTKMEGRGGVSQNGGGSLKKELDVKREAAKPEERSTKTEEEVAPELLTVRTILAKEHGLAAGERKHKHLNASNSKKSRNSYLKTIEEKLSEEQPSLDWQTLKERKIQEVMAKSEKHRKSVYISRDLQRKPRPKKSSKVRVFSPRTHSRVEICKIKALQDIARAKKAAAKERKVQQVRTGLDSFAVVKCSYDPQQDFRDSMVEMIVEKKMTRPDDLEELLACYLTLNSDEYHDLIIKVFRQVWFDLNQVSFGSGILQKQQCYND